MNLQMDSEMRSGHKPESERNRWVGAAILIALGVIFLLQNTTGVQFRNWWALFILIPAVPAYMQAWNFYQLDEGRFTRRVIGAFLSAFTPTFVALIFLLNLNWGGVWPVFLILAGLGALMSQSDTPNR